MFGARRRGFDWKEVAKVLQMTRATVQATFLQKIKRARSKDAQAPQLARVIQQQNDSGAQKIRKPRVPRKTTPRP